MTAPNPALAELAKLLAELAVRDYLAECEAEAARVQDLPPEVQT